MTEIKKHLCPVCQADDWHPLDTMVITCPKCVGQKTIQTAPDVLQACDLCKGNGRVNYQLRDQKYWFDKNFLYEEQVGMKVCKACGFVTYSPRWTEEELRKRYTQERCYVNPNLIVRANLKNDFHEFFLSNNGIDFKSKDISILDIGCSFGHIRKLFQNAKVYGIEYSKTFSKYAKNANNVSIIEETKELPDKSINFVMAYHTLEHVSNPRETLLEAKRVLADGGLLYLGLPTFFKTLREVSGSSCLDFENLYHLNHNNVFSHAALCNILHQCGFEIIKTDAEYYGEAVLCKVNDSIDKEIVKEDYRVIENRLYRQRMAIDIMARSYNNQDSDKAMMGIEAAISQYPSYVDAYEAMMVQKNKYKDVKLLFEVWEKAVAANCETMHLRDRFAIMLTNWCDAGQVNNFIKKAEELFKKSLSFFPGNIEALMGLAKINAYNYKNVKETEKYCEKILQLNPIAWSEVQNILAHLHCME